MFESGAFVAARLDQVADVQVQPNGVDLTLDSVHVQTAPGRISRDVRGSDAPASRSVASDDGKRVGDREERSPDDGYYRLDRGGYVVQYAERIAVPEGHVGFVYPRSTLLRNSCMLNTAVWDAGYEGRGEGLLQVHHPIELEPGARIAQFVLAEADHEGRYDGDYQGERM